MMTDTAGVSDHILDEAIGWMMALQEGLVDGERVALDTWLAADARHRIAWGRLESSFTPFRVLEAQSVSGRQLAVSLVRRRMSRRAVISNSALTALSVATSTIVVDRVSPLSGIRADYSTATGQRKTFALPDGSALTLDARSVANLSHADGVRGLALISGKASLNVAPRASLFRVTSGDVISSVTSGSLMVSNLDDECKVICRVGRIDLTVPQASNKSIIGMEGVAVRDGRVRPLLRDEVRDASSWLEGKIILHDRPLQELIDAFRPYRAGILSISTEAARLRVSGVFNLDRFEEVLDLIPEVFPVRVTQVGQLFTRIEFVR